MKNFEKNIKTKASAFQMDPMPDSFDKVMAALEKKKKRRFIFWLWFLIPGLAIGGTIGIYQVLSHSNKTTLAHYHTEQVTDSNENSIGKTDPLTDLNNTTTPINNTNSSSTTVNEKNTTETFVDQNIEVKKNDQTTFAENKDHLNKKTIIKTDSNQTNSDTKTAIIDKTNKENNDEKNITTTDPKKRINQSTIKLFSHSLVYIPPTKREFLFTIKDVPRVPNILPVTKQPFSRFSLGIYTDLGISKSSFFTSVPEDSTPQGSYTGARSFADKFLFSYSAGINFRYSPVKFLAIETGIGFTHYEAYQIIANSGITSSSVMDTEPDTVLSFATYNPAYKEYYNTYDYISIPLKLYYQNRWTVMGIEAGGGVIFDIPVNTRSYSADENTGASYLQKEVEGSRLNRFGVLAVANVNVVFHIGKFSIFGGPVFKYRLNSMFDDQYIMQQRPYFIGGQLGVRYNF